MTLVKKDALYHNHNITDAKHIRKFTDFQQAVTKLDPEYIMHMDSPKTMTIRNIKGELIAMLELEIKDVRFFGDQSVAPLAELIRGVRDRDYRV